MAYQLHLNPQQTAALNIAISFWERKEVKDKAAEIVKFWNTMDSYECHLKWNEFTKEILDEWKDDSLAQKLENESIYIIKIIGKTIFNWYQIINLKYTTGEELINYIDEIKWTPYGTVDEVETFKSSWLNNSNLDIIRVYNFACHHALEDHIDNLWNKIPRNMQNIVSNNNIYSTFDKHILAYWKHRRDNDLPNFVEYLQGAINYFNTDEVVLFDNIHGLHCSRGECMLRLSVHQGYFNATKYFWELTKTNRDESVVKCARIAVTCYSDKYEYDRIGDYKISQYSEICMFLINQMSNYQKWTLFNEKLRLDGSHQVYDVDVKDAILKMLLSTWPWEELFIPVLKDMMMQCRSHDSQMECTFLDVITNRMLENYHLGYSLETDKYRYLLREAWLIIPAFIKQKFIQFKTIFTVIHNLIKVWDLDSLNLVLNDQAIAASVRDKFIKMGLSSYHLFLNEDKSEKLDQFVEKILRSEEEKKQFKQMINNLEDFIEVSKFQLPDKMLEWQSSTPEEKQALMNDIDHIKFCENFIRMDDYELLNKFLDWRFNTEEEKRECREHFKNNEFSIEVICEIWKRCNEDINSAKEKCSQFLHWLFESEEEIALFKKEMVVNFESNKSNMIDFANFQLGSISFAFISWCLLDDDNFQLSQRMLQAVI